MLPILLCGIRWAAGKTCGSSISPAPETQNATIIRIYRMNLFCLIKQIAYQYLSPKNIYSSEGVGLGFELLAGKSPSNGLPLASSLLDNGSGNLTL